MRLPRPHVPLEVRCRVALRQTGASAEFAENVIRYHRRDPRAPAGTTGFGRLLRIALKQLAEKLGCPMRDLRLDHDPALGLRKKIRRGGKIVGYVPHANDPNSLLYRSKDGHHVKTNVRGDGAQRSDTARMKRERRRTSKKPKRKYRWAKGRKIENRGFDKRGKKPWRT